MRPWYGTHVRWRKNKGWLLKFGQDWITITEKRAITEFKHCFNMEETEKPSLIRIRVELHELPFEERLEYILRLIEDFERASLIFKEDLMTSYGKEFDPLPLVLKLREEVDIMAERMGLTVKVDLGEYLQMVNQKMNRGELTLDEIQERVKRASKEDGDNE